MTYWDPEKEERIRKKDPMLELFLWRYESLKEFRRQHPHAWTSARSAIPEESSLGVWVRTMRLRFARNQLPPYQIKLLDALDILQRPGNPKWRPNYLAVKSLIAAHGKHWCRHAGESLAGWALKQSKQIALGILPAPKERLLRELGGHFLPVDRWGDGYRQLLAYRRRFPDRWPAAGERMPEGYDVGLWCQRQRKAWERVRLKERQIKSLQEIDFSFESGFLEDRWVRYFGDLKAFRKRHPHRWPINSEMFPPGSTLGRWCALQKRNYRTGLLEPKRRGLLEGIGFPFQLTAEEAWNEQFRDLENWRRRHPETWPTRNESDAEEKRLSHWISNQRLARKSAVCLRIASGC